MELGGAKDGVRQEEPMCAAEGMMVDSTKELRIRGVSGGSGKKGM